MQSKPLRVAKTVWLTAAIALAMLLFAYFLLGIYPFGNGTVLTGDLKGQYISYYAHFRRVFTSGAGFAYGLDKGLGGSLLGLFAYYVSSPLNLLYLLVPNSGIAVMASIMLALKIVLACMACVFYLAKKYPNIGLLAIPLALGYGFCAYTLVYAQNIMWHDVVILLPLICHGIDKIINGGRGLYYTAALAVAIFANFYIAYMACIFAVLYFLYSILAQKQSKTLWRKASLRFAGSSLLAGGLCGVLLLPSLANINASKGSLAQVGFSWQTNFPLLRLPERLVWGNFAWVDVENGLPEIYFGILALLLLACWFANSKVPLWQKLLSAGVLAILIVSFWVSGLDVLWHGGKATIWFPYRNSFIFSFFCIVLAGGALQKGLPGKKTLACAFGVLAVLFGYMLAFPIAVSRSKMLLTLGVLALLALALFALQKVSRPLIKRALVLALVGITALELAMQSFYIVNQFEKYTYSEFNAFLQQAGQTVQAIQGQDEGAYRIEKTVWHSMNDSMLLDYHGITHFGSTQDSASVQGLEALGYLDTSLYSTGSTAFADSLLGIRYLFADGSVPPPAHMQPTTLQTPYTVYQNPYAFPLVFAAQSNPNALAAQYNNSQTTFAYQNQLYQALTGTGQNILLPVTQVQAHNKSGQAIPLTGPWPVGSQYTITAEQPGYYYAQIMAETPYNVYMQVDGETTGFYFTIDGSRTIQLGYLQAGQTVSLAWHTDIDMEFTTAEFMYTPRDLLVQAAHQAWEQSGSFAVQDGYIGGSITTTEEQTVLFTSLPYDENWTATVNGKKVTPQRYMAHFMAVPLTPGQNDVKLQYKTPLFWQGLVVSALCAAAYVCLVACPRAKKPTP